MHATLGFFDIGVCLDAHKAIDNINNHKYWKGVPCKDPQDAKCLSLKTILAGGVAGALFISPKFKRKRET